MSHLETYRKKHGGDWPYFVRDMKPVIRAQMRDEKIECLAAFSDYLHRTMTADGRDPTFLMAVCEEMQEEQRTAELKP